MWENILASSVVLICFVLILVVIYGVFSFWNVSKQKKFFQELHLSLKPGQKVVLANGIHGTIKSVNEETVDLAIKSGAIMEVSRYAISSIEQ